MNPNRDGIEGPLIAEPEANHGESVTPSNDAQIAPLQRLSFQMSILLKLAKVSDLLALLQPIRRLQDLHLNLHRFPLKAKHYLRVEWKKESCPYLLLQPVPPPDMKECQSFGGWYVLSVLVWGTPIKESTPILPVVDLLMAGSCFLLSLLVPTPLVFASIAPESADQRSEYVPFTARGGLDERPLFACFSCSL
ncbi:hypothetical protein SESBI_24849 [Sesbania bispinosa]|nr:hypothetical protein SESBI_24849 [Sesbania bispinosa]